MSDKRVLVIAREAFSIVSFTSVPGGGLVSEISKPSKLSQVVDGSMGRDEERIRDDGELSQQSEAVHRGGTSGDDEERGTENASVGDGVVDKPSFTWSMAEEGDTEG